LIVGDSLDRFVASRTHLVSPGIKTNT